MVSTTLPKKVILLRACGYRSSMYNPPYGVLQIAAPLLKAGYEVVVVDGDQIPDPVTEAANHIGSNVVCAGVSCEPGTVIMQGLKFSKLMKDHNIPVIWGGALPSMVPLQVLSHPFVDFIIKGEGEETFLELAENIQNKSKYKEIDGIGYKENGRFYINKERPFVDLDKLDPIPCHLIKNFEWYLYPQLNFPDCKRAYRLYTNRGCYFKCTFCYNSLVNKNSWRSLTPENIVSQIKFVKEKFDIDTVQLAGDNFFMDKTIAIETAKLMIKERVNIKWCAHCTVATFNTFDDEYLKILKESGLHIIKVGIEVGSDRMLKLLKKCTTVEGILKFSEKIKEYCIHASAFFMLGLPQETKEDLLATVLLVEKLSENPYFYNISPAIYVPYPGTELYNEAVRLGFKDDRTTLESWAKPQVVGRSILPFSEEYKDLLTAIFYYYKAGSVFRNTIIPKILKNLKFLFFHNRVIPFLLARIDVGFVNRVFVRCFYKQV